MPEVTEKKCLKCLKQKVTVHGILEIVPPLAGWFCNFGSDKSDLNLGANSAKLFLSEP